jgi:hypothetical protein
MADGASQSAQEWITETRRRLEEEERGGSPGNGPTAPPLGSRPIVRIIEGQLPRVIDAAEAVIAKNDPEIFEFGSEVVYIGREPAPPDYLVAYPRRTMFRYEKAHLAEQWGRFVDFQKFDGRSNNWKSIDCPPDKIAAPYLQRKGRRQLRPLRAVISTPTLRPDGSILDRPGYDEASSLFFDPCGLNYPEVPEQPSRDDAFEALELLKTPIALFPYVPDDPNMSSGRSASRSVTLSAVLTGLIRPSLPTAPLHSSTAPVAGSGKSMLDNIVAMLVTGRTCYPVAETEDVKEFEKRLATALIKGAQIIGLDNLTVPLGGGLLSQALTEPVITIRDFGLLRDVTVENAALILANGNNLVIQGDVIRRVLRAALDPRCERPELRQFSFSPLRMTAEARPILVIAGLTILRAHHLAGRPKQPGAAPLGSFEEWSDWVRAALVWLEEPDPCLTIASARDTDPTLKRLRRILPAWRALFPGSATVKRAVQEAQTHTNGYDNPELAEQRANLLDVFQDIAQERNDINQRRLGKWIAQHKDRVVDSLCFQDQGDRQHATLWKVVSITS